MKFSVIVTTYNQPQYLQLVLHALNRQTVSDFEVIVCDDGSSAETSELIALHRKEASFPLLHYWHEDTGFRPGQSRNGGIKASSGEWLIFIDGDMVVHPRFIESHGRSAGTDTILFGGRVKLNDSFSKSLDPKQLRDVGMDELFSRSKSFCREEQYSPVNENWTDTLSGKVIQSLGGKRRPVLNGFWAAICGILPRSKEWSATFKSGSNFSTSRDVINQTNGFNEDFGSGGGEDGELFWRVFNTGAKAKPVLFSAIAYHLYHPDNWQRAGELRDAALAIERQTKTSTIISCERGLSEHDYGEMR